jgi:hypothetical protein
MLYKVGELLEEGKTSYQEGVRFDYTHDGAILLLFYNNADEKELLDIRKGSLKIGMYVKDEVIFMLFKFASQNWIDAPYSVHLSKLYEFDNIAEGMGIGLHIFLVDASTGILKAMRLIGLPTKFSKSFQKAVLAQKEIEFDKSKYAQKINMVYGNYSTDDLVEGAEIVKFREE